MKNLVNPSKNPCYGFIYDLPSPHANMASQSLMKDGLGKSAVLRLCSSLISAGADFNPDHFLHDAMDGLEELELKERVNYLSEVMVNHMPQDFETCASILEHLKKHWNQGDSNDNLRSFAAWPILDFVAKKGLNQPDLSLPLLRYLTPIFSAEFAIREFLIQYPDRAYHEMLMWCLDPDPHVRRLASEGIRPRLPWGKQLPQYIQNPHPVITLLKNLVDDPSDYVRRSVANNLNDISKDHPDLVVETCQLWKKDRVKARDWIIRHGTRTLVKKGHPKVFSLLGFTQKPKIHCSQLELSPAVIELGKTLHLSFSLTSISSKEQTFVIDYAIHFVKANGKLAKKVFKWKNAKLKPRATLILEKAHPIKPITTRKYYAGEHQVEILINGKRKGKAAFLLQIS